MSSRKADTEGIDEALLLDSIGRRKQDGTLYRAQEPPVPAPEEESCGDAIGLYCGKYERGRPPQETECRLHDDIPQTQRDQNTPMRLYQPGNT